MAVVRDEDWKYALSVFIAESMEMLDSVEPRLMHLETLKAGDPDTLKLLNEIFRLFHSLKGGAASFDLNVIRDVTHHMENLLDIFRSKNKPVLAVHIDLMCKTCDLIRKSLPRVATEFIDLEFTDEAAEIRNQIAPEVAILEGKAPTAPAAASRSAVPATAAGSTIAPEKTPVETTTPGDDETAEDISFETFFTPPHSNFSGSCAELNLQLTPTMLKEFVEGAEGHFAKIESAIEGFDENADNSVPLTQAAREAHVFMGLAIFFGYPTLSDLAYLVEKVAGATGKGLISNPLDTLGLLIESMAALRNGLECLRSSKEVVVDPDHSISSRLESTLRGAKPLASIEKKLDARADGRRALEAGAAAAISDSKPATKGKGSLDELKIAVSPKMLDDFIGFSRELFQEALATLALLKTDATAIDKIEKAFRSIHSFTGTAKFYGFLPLATFAQVCERVLHQLIKHPMSTYSGPLERVEKAVEAMQAIVERLKESGADLQEPETLVLAKLNESLAELRKKEGQAEFFPINAPLEEIFDPAALKTFTDEYDAGIATLGQRLSEWGRDLEDVSFAEIIGSTVHSLKSSVINLISSAKKPLPPKHPLQVFRVVAHGAEMLVTRDLEAGEARVGAGEFETLSQSLDALKGLRTAFLNRESTAFINDELLSRLSINAAQFRETDLALMEACLKNVELCPPSQAQEPIQAYIRSLRNLETASKRLGRTDIAQALIKQKTLIESWLAAPDIPFSTRIPELKRGYAALLETIHAPPPPELAAAVKKVAKPAAGAHPGEAGPAKGTLRIDEEKIDRLLRAVGELFVVCESFSLLEKQMANGANLSTLSQRMRETGESMATMTGELEKGLMSIRLVPVRTVFQRFPRIIRDLAKQLGKEVQLVLKGEETEIDKKTLEQINDPLVHIIRNSVDHGVEMPDKRKAAGKPAEGLVTLSAALRDDHIFITITDDGKGLDALVLKRKAVEKGVLSTEEAAAMSEREAFNLIFAAGFSTAEKVTDVSGRGVGMDVVRNNIAALQGTVEIDSKVGFGSTFTLKLPIQKLALMVFQTILVQAGSEEYLLPMENVAYLTNIPVSEMHTYTNMQFVPIHGKLYPMAFLDRLLETVFPIPAHKPRPDLRLDPNLNMLSIALIRCPAGEYALGLDRFISEERVVVKPLKCKLIQSPLFSGTAIMGDGRVSLVLEPIQLATHFTRYSEYIAEAGDLSRLPAPLPKKSRN